MQQQNVQDLTLSRAQFSTLELSMEKHFRGCEYVKNWRNYLTLISWCLIRPLSSIHSQNAVLVVKRGVPAENVLALEVLHCLLSLPLRSIPSGYISLLLHSAAQ